MKLLAILTMVLVAFFSLPAQVPITNGVVSIDFNDFRGAGFAPNPVSGQLDSGDWSVIGLSEGDLLFDSTKTAGDFARGNNDGNVITGGIYAFQVSTGDYTLGVQPGGSDFTKGEFILLLINNTGSAISQINLQYDIYVMNDQGRSNYFNCLWSTDNTTYTPLTQLDYTSPLAADPSPAWQKITRMTTITGLNIGDSGYFYIKWESDDVGGSGARDEFALDNILLSPGDTPLPVSLVSFTARSVPEGVVLRWETASEMENAGFEIYRRIANADKEVLLASWQWVPELAGQGNSHQNHTYCYVDRQVVPGESYVYVLADVDYTGRRRRHPAITVNHTQTGMSEELIATDFEVLPNYPNPFNPETTIPVIVEQLNSNLLTFEVFDLLGRKVYEEQKAITSPGTYYFHWRSGEGGLVNCSSGIFVGKIQLGNTSKYIKLLLNK